MRSSLTSEQFLEALRGIFSHTSADLIQPDTEFKSLQEYDSIIALTIMATMDQVHGLRVTAAHIRDSTTFGELYRAATLDLS